MSVRLEGTIKRFIGDSRDDKPLTDVNAGSSFLETDTGAIYRFDGRRWTIPDLEKDHAYFQQILIVLEEIRDLLAEGL